MGVAGSPHSSPSLTACGGSGFSFGVGLGVDGCLVLLLSLSISGTLPSCPVFRKVTATSPGNVHCVESCVSTSV